MRKLISVYYWMENSMKDKLEILDKYEKLLKIKKMIVILGAFTGIILFLGLLLRKFNYMLSAKIFIGISIIATLLICLLWISIKPIKKYILTLIDGK